MPLATKYVPFNRFPQNFFYVPGDLESPQVTKKFPVQQIKHVRAKYADGVMKVWAVQGGNINLIYEATLPLESFIRLGGDTAKWVDPGTERQFSLQKTTGCGCSWSDSPLRKFTPDA